MNLDKYGWDLVKLDFDTRNIARLYKTVRVKENINYEIPYHSELWILKRDNILFFTCKCVKDNCSIVNI